MSYGEYLHLDELLNCQHPRTQQHDEMLFVIIHQATELWMKLAVHELQAALEQLRADDLPPAFKMLSRFSRIQSQLIQSWDVLSTLTPSEYLTFRDSLGSASGFQSLQYRLIEFYMGNKNARHVAQFEPGSPAQQRLQAALRQPSIYQSALLLLAKRGFSLSLDTRREDWSEPYTPDESVAAAWLQVYADTQRYWDLYELAEKLVDIEDWFRQWRFRHLTTVERIIGSKRGTGGTAGASYLRKALETRLFPELWDVRTVL
jgi:tryptophan 2,3-dioxygenase